MGASPTYVPVIRTGVNVAFANVTVTGLSVRGAGDTQPRLALASDGSLGWGTGAAVADTTLSRTGVGALGTPGFFAMGSGQSSGGFSVFTGAANALRIGTAGGGIAVAEGANARSGGATLVAGTVAVANTSVTAATRVHLTRSTAGGGALGHLSVVVTAGVGFTVSSSAVTDVSSVNWLLIEPA